jgi:hypothetical protein
MTLVNKALQPIALQHLYRHATANFDREDSPICAPHLREVINTSDFSIHLNFVMNTGGGQCYFRDWLKSLKLSRTLSVSFLGIVLTPSREVCSFQQGWCRCTRKKSCDFTGMSFICLKKMAQQDP